MPPTARVTGRQPSTQPSSGTVTAAPVHPLVIWQSSDPAEIFQCLCDMGTQLQVPLSLAVVCYQHVEFDSRTLIQRKGDLPSQRPISKVCGVVILVPHRAGYFGCGDSMVRCSVVGS